MNEEISNIIESGLLEGYCFGTLEQEEMRKVGDLARLYPDIGTEIERIFVELAKLKSEQKGDLKSKILNKLGSLQNDSSLDLHNLPQIDQHADVRAWRKAIQGLDPDHRDDSMAFRVISDRPNNEISVVWLYGSLIETGHEESSFRESFLILEGECECDFGGVIARFKAGDYFEVPSNTPHVIRNISRNSDYVKGIVQRIAC
ncbi:MAG: cupin domain-containing protein [Saprospiraceae bacterium]